MWGYEVYFKDDNVCAMVPKDKNSKSRPISISQKPGPNGLSVQIIEHALFEARLDSFDKMAEKSLRKKSDRAFRQETFRYLRWTDHRELFELATPKWQRNIIPLRLQYPEVGQITSPTSARLSVIS